MVTILSDSDYNEIFHHAPCGYLNLDGSGVIVKVNQTFCNWLKYEPEELEGQLTFQDLLSVGGKIYFDSHFMPLLQLQGQVTEINFDIPTKTGKRIPVLVNAIKVKSADGEIGFRLTIVDITQRKQYERELLRAKKLAEENAAKLAEKNTELERFSHVVSHDLKSPLRTMSGLFEIMDSKGFVSQSEGSIKIQKMIMSNLRRMKLLVDDLLDQTLAEKETEYSEDVDLNEIVETVKDVLRDEIEKSSARVEMEVLPQVQGNRSQLIRLFQNLIMNAIKYRSEEDPHIRVTCQQVNKMAEITIKDNGIGFDPEFEERIFEYMRRLHTHDQIPGSGLGLYSCKKIVESHGGIIRAESKPDFGSSFIFTLPLESGD